MDIYFYLKFWLSFKRKALITRKLETVYELESITGNQINKNGFLKDIKLFAFDVDDTIAEHKGEISKKTILLLQSLQEKGYKVAIISNCGRHRRAELSAAFGPLGIDIEPSNFKPNPWGYLQICKRAGVKPENCAMVGEKMGTDMYGAYLAGYKERMLVKPFTEVFGGKKSNYMERFIRQMENMTVK